MDKRIYFAIMILMLAPRVLFGQPGGDPTPGGDTVPIDGGVAFLAASGIAYGLKKFRDRSRQKD
jgi:hypothetical protein